MSVVQETWVLSQVRKIPWRRKWQPTPVLLSGKFHEHRSPVGYSLWDSRVSHDRATLLLKIEIKFENICFYTHLVQSRYFKTIVKTQFGKARTIGNHSSLPHENASYIQLSPF